MYLAVFQTSATSQITAPFAPPSHYNEQNIERLKLSYQHVYQKKPNHLHIVVIADEHGRWMGFTAVAWETYIPMVGIVDIPAEELSKLGAKPQPLEPRQPWEQDGDWWKKGLKP